MDLLEINGQVSYRPDNKFKKVSNSIDQKDDLHQDLNDTTFNDKDNSNISKDANILYDFFNRIQNGKKDNNKMYPILEYTSEYKKIKKEISDGVYGKDIDKYNKLLDNAFKNVLDNASNLLIKSLSKPVDNNKKKMSFSSLVSCKKQYERGTTLVWIFSAENKRILREIEYYKKKKNYKMVHSLTRLSKNYKHVINNISGAVDMIKTSMDDSFDSSEAEKIKITPEM